MSPAPAQKPRVHYRITPAQPRAHLFDVDVTIDAPNASGQGVHLPVWIPGSYLVREFARHIVELRAEAGGKPVVLEKVSKAAWRTGPLPAGAPLSIHAQIYAWDLSVRAAHFDTTHAFFNGPSVFLAVDGQEDAPCDVMIEPPSDDLCRGWRVATTLPPKDVRPPGFGLYVAESYAHLIDHPVEMGTFETVDWTSAGVPHQMAITGRTRFDKERLAHDLAKVCAEHIALFQEAPMQRYLFLTTALGDGYGGLEHKDSTALICKRDDLPKLRAHAGSGAPAEKKRDEGSEGYKGFLGLCSHEYFHLWNVKRIKPAAFTPYRLDEENYTRTLWAFEGITSYYDDLALVRAGVISVEAWLEMVGKTITRVLRSHGRHRQSVADSSFDAWIKFYRPDENTPNAVVSYYTKGSLVALALDLTIRQATAEKKSLDDVMRLLWQRHGKAEVGVPEDGVERIASEVAGVDLSPFFDVAVRGTEDLALAPLLAPYGIELHLRPAEGDADQGGKPGKKAKGDGHAAGALGVSVGAGEHGALLSVVHHGGAAQQAGLSAGDVVIACDGLRVGKAALLRMAAERGPASKLRLHVFRRDELFDVEVTLQAPPADTAYLTLRADAAADTAVRRAEWLKSRTPTP